MKSGDILEIKAKPNSSKSEIVYNFETKAYDIFLKSIADKNKANQELKKLFKKEFGLKVEIISGEKTRNKKIKVL